jgi:hypothetical protein
LRKGAGAPIAAPAESARIGGEVGALASVAAAAGAVGVRAALVLCSDAKFLDAESRVVRAIVLTGTALAAFAWHLTPTDIGRNTEGTVGVAGAISIAGALLAEEVATDCISGKAGTVAVGEAIHAVSRAAKGLTDAALAVGIDPAGYEDWELFPVPAGDAAVNAGLAVVRFLIVAVVNAPPPAAGLERLATRFFLPGLPVALLPVGLAGRDVEPACDTGQ